MARNRNMSAHHARKIVAKAAQKTKVRAIISQLSSVGGVTNTITIAAAGGGTRSNYFDTNVPFYSKIQVLHVDIAIYQSGAAVAADGFVDWAILKNPGGSVTVTNPSGTGLTNIPYTFRTGRAAVPMLSSTAMPTIYHISGDIKIPPRFQLFGPGDTLVFIWNGNGGAVDYSVNGTITYMYKV